MISECYNPIDGLKDIVEYYWNTKVTLNSTVVHYYPPPLLQGLAFSFQKQHEKHEFGDKKIELDKHSYFFGQPTCRRTITNSGSEIDILGVKLTPLGIVKLTGIQMENMANSIVNANDVWGSDFSMLFEQMQSMAKVEQRIAILEKFLLKKCSKIRLHYRVNNVENALSLIKNLKGSIGVSKLMYETNTSRRTLERAFKNYLGITPKLYCELTRFNAAKEWMDTNLLNQNLSGLAFDLNYCDGSHFSAEFKRFADMTPMEYIKSGKSAKILSV